MNGPLEFFFLEVAVVNADWLLVNDGIKTVFEPIYSGVSCILFVGKNIINRCFDLEFIFQFAHQRIHPTESREAFEALKGLDILS